MISRCGHAILLAAIVAGCGTQDKGAVATSTGAATAASSKSTKPTDGWSTATTETSMDGKKIVASKKYARLSADGVTKSIINVGLTCTVATKSLSVAMRAVDFDKQLQSEVPTQFDSELENLALVPVGRVKAKDSKPMPLGAFFSLKQDNDLVVWDVSNLAVGSAPVAEFLDDKSRNETLLMMAQMIIGIPNADKYANVNSMFSGERPWVIEVSTGKDPFEITIPADSESVNEVLGACSAYPAVYLQTAKANGEKSTAVDGPNTQPQTELTMDQIYAAAENGHLDQAQEMIGKVLAEHPSSAKAHYVQAELYTKEGKTEPARSELATAEQLKPGLPFASPQAVQELKSRLGLDASVIDSKSTPPPPPAIVSTSSAESAPNQGARAEVPAASFDCAKAGTAVEKIICASPELSAADSEMAAEYRRMYSAAGPNAPAVKQGQREFISKRNQCTTSDCVASAYKARRVELAQLGP